MRHFHVFLINSSRPFTWRQCLHDFLYSKLYHKALLHRNVSELRLCCREPSCVYYDPMVAIMLDKQNISPPVSYVKWWLLTVYEDRLPRFNLTSLYILLFCLVATAKFIAYCFALISNINNFWQQWKYYINLPQTFNILNIFNVFEQALIFR